MTGALSQHPVHPGPEVLQHGEWHKGLGGAREAAPVDPEGSLTIQQMVDVFKYYGQGTPTIPTELVKKNK